MIGNQSYHFNREFRKRVSWDGHSISVDFDEFQGTLEDLQKLMNKARTIMCVSPARELYIRTGVVDDTACGDEAQPSFEICTVMTLDERERFYTWEKLCEQEYLARQLAALQARLEEAKAK